MGKVTNQESLQEVMPEQGGIIGQSLKAPKKKKKACGEKYHEECIITGV